MFLISLGGANTLLILNHDHRWGLDRQVLHQCTSLLRPSGLVHVSNVGMSTLSSVLEQFNLHER